MALTRALQAGGEGAMVFEIRRGRDWKGLDRSIFSIKFRRAHTAIDGSNSIELKIMSRSRPEAFAVSLPVAWSKQHGAEDNRRRS